jgi:hypothetical protein
MPNPIKYNVSAETLALKKGNFWIGTGDVGKGPTSSTGYYNGITPPSGGYTIYLNKESNGPSIYTVNTESQLTGLTSSIAGQTLTTSGACLNWFATQTDKMILNKDYPPIITNGLVMNLDAAFTPSYPTTETTWYDVSSGGNNGTLVNGPTYNPDYGGSIVFDGTDDTVSFPEITLGSTFTISQTLVASATNNNIGYMPIGGGHVVSGSTYRGYVWLQTNNNSTNPVGATVSIAFRQNGESGGFDFGLPTSISRYTLFQYTLVKNGSTVYFYINGNLITTQSVESGRNFTVRNLGWSYSSYYMNRNLYNTQIYNRALSTAEMSQNYCATVPIVTNGLIFNVDAGTQLSYVSGSTSWVDTAGNTVGALTNNPTYNSSNVGSIVFDGADDYVAWPNNPLSSLTSAKTYDVWVKFTNAQNTFTLGCSTLNVYLQNNSTWYINQVGASAINISTWTFSSGWTNFIYSFDGTNHLCYINGVSYVVNSGGGVSSQTVLYIGSRVNLDSFLNGNIATTRVYNRGLSATEILQNYNATKGRFGL